MKRKIEKLRIDSTVELNEENLIRNFSLQVSDGKGGEVNNYLILMSSMMAFKNSMESFLEEDGLPDEDRMNFECVLGHIGDIMLRMCDMWEDDEEEDKTYLLN